MDLTGRGALQCDTGEGTCLVQSDVPPGEMHGQREWGM